MAAQQQSPQAAMQDDNTLELAPTRISDDGQMLSGHGEPGGRVTVYDCLDRVLAQGLAHPHSGLYRLRLQPPLAAADVVRVDIADVLGRVCAHEIICAPGEVPAWPTGAKVTRNGSAVVGMARPGASLRMEHPNGQTVETLADPRNGSFKVPLDPPLCHGELVSVFAESGYFVEWLSDNAPLTEVEGPAKKPRQR